MSNGYIYIYIFIFREITVIPNLSLKRLKKETQSDEPIKRLATVKKGQENYRWLGTHTLWL